MHFCNPQIFCKQVHFLWINDSNICIYPLNWPSIHLSDPSDYHINSIFKRLFQCQNFLCHCYLHLSRLWMGLPGITLWSNYSINQFCIMFLNFNPALLNMFKETIYFCNFVLKNKRKHLSTLLNLDKFRHSVNNFNLHWVLFCWKQVQILQLEYVKIHL